MLKIYTIQSTFWSFQNHFSLFTILEYSENFTNYNSLDTQTCRNLILYFFTKQIKKDRRKIKKKNKTYLSKQRSMRFRKIKDQIANGYMLEERIIYRK